MTTGTTTLLSLALPVEGELDGTWGDVVNYGITDYVDIAVAGTLTLTGDGAVTLANTAGDASGTNIGSTTAQYAVIKIAGTLTTTKVVTAPSTSKTYIVDNAATGGTVTFKASGQTGVSVAVGEKCTVYFNGTDYVKVASSVTDGVSTISFGSTGLTPATATSGAVTVAGTLAVANGGTGVTTSTGTGNTVLSNSPTLVTPTLGTPASATLTNATGLPISTGVSGLGSGVATALAANVGSAGAPVINGGVLGTPSSGTATNLTGLPLTTGVTGILPVANGGNGTATPSLVAGSNISVTGTWPNQTIATTGGSGTVTGVTASSPLASSGGTTPNISFTGTLAVANGGTGTSSPSLVAGSNVTISGTWPNQTIAAVGGGGGTAGVYAAVATGNLANGSKVVINTDGTVSIVNSNNQSAGSATTFVSSTAVSDVCATYDVTNSKVVIAYIAGNAPAALYAVVGTVSGTSISFGTPVFVVANCVFTSITYDTAQSKVVIAYGTSSTNVGAAVVGTVSGTSISFGTAVSFVTGAYPTYVNAAYEPTQSRIVIAYTDLSNSAYGTAVVGSVSGTSITFGTPVVIIAANALRAFSVASVGSSKVVISAANITGSQPYYGQALVGTVTSTSISFGSPVTFNSGTTNEIVSAYDATNSKLVIAFSDAGTSDYGTAIVGTISGTSISFGAKVVFESAYVGEMGIAYSSTPNRIVICWSKTYATTITGTVSGTSITFGYASAANAVSSLPVTGLVYDPTSQKVVLAYRNNSSNLGASQVLTVGTNNLTATNFIGISDSAYASGATAAIQTVGSTDDAQSGLTAGLAYYVQPDGTLSSTAGSPSVFAGTAVSATKLIIKG